MLAMYAMLLLQMLTGRDYHSFDESSRFKVAEQDLASLQEIEPELKCILYECLHAQDKTLQREEDRYDFEIQRLINRELNVKNGGSDKTFLEQEAFKDAIKLEKQKADAENEQIERMTRRKPENPRANLKNFEAENSRMGVTHEVDLILNEIDRAKAQS